MRRYKVADEREYGHKDVFCNGNDIGPSDLGYCNATVGLVCCIQIDMVRTNTRSDGELELLGFLETLSSQVARMEAIWSEMISMRGRSSLPPSNIAMTYGVVMMTSASTNSWSNFEFSPSLSEVVTKVWP